MASRKPRHWNFEQWKDIHAYHHKFGDELTNDDKNDMKQFITDLVEKMKCKGCQIHAQRFIEKYNIDDICKDKQTFFKFFIDYHNDVNKECGKPLISYDEAEKLYCIIP
jgi:fatty-acid desaturase